MPTTGKKPFSLYFHLPFCEHRCPYCHFFVLPNEERFKDECLQALKEELALYGEEFKDKSLKSIYFGGGTPSLFSVPRLASLCENTFSYITDMDPHLEITLEANPNDVTAALFKAYLNLGVNRISLGVQTLDNRLLQILERKHNGRQSLDAINILNDLGCTNISIDLMYDLPDQTLTDWEQTLFQIPYDKIHHISLYNLQLEPQSVFYKFKEQIHPRQPSDNNSLAMYQMAQETFALHGLQQYEISAFARAEKKSCHNTGYWSGRPFLGFGPSAFSYWNGKRFQKSTRFRRYVNSLKRGVDPIEFSEELPHDAHIRELFCIRLRLLEGINLLEFEGEVAPLSPDHKNSLISLNNMGLISLENNCCRLTSKGILFYDSVASELVS